MGKKIIFLTPCPCESCVLVHSNPSMDIRIVSYTSMCEISGIYVKIVVEILDSSKVFGFLDNLEYTLGSSTTSVNSYAVLRHGNERDRKSMAEITSATTEFLNENPKNRVSIGRTFYGEIFVTLRLGFDRCYDILRIELA